MLAGSGFRGPNADFGRHVEREGGSVQAGKGFEKVSTPLAPQHTHTPIDALQCPHQRQRGKKRPNRPMTGIVFSAAQTTWKSNELMFSSH